MKYLGHFQLIFLGVAFLISLCDIFFEANLSQLIFIPLIASLGCGGAYHVGKKKLEKSNYTNQKSYDYQ